MSMSYHHPYPVVLTDEETTALRAYLKKSHAAGRKYLRARILLLSAELEATDRELAQVLHTSPDTIQRTRKRFAEGGVAFALAEQPRTGATRRLTEEHEQLVIALACDTPPVGHPVWTMQLLADTLVAFAIVDRISDETVRRTLKKTT